MKRHAILRKLAYKWIRILFRCWKTSTEYDPQRYEAIIKTKTPEIVQYFPKTKQKSPKPLDENSEVSVVQSVF